MTSDVFAYIWDLKCDLSKLGKSKPLLPVTKLQTTLDFFRFPSTAWRGSPSVPRRTKCRGGHQAQTSQAASDQLSGFEVIQKSDLHRARRRLKLSSYGLTQGIDLRKPWFLTYCLPWLSMFIMFFFFKGLAAVSVHRGSRYDSHDFPQSCETNGY